MGRSLEITRDNIKVEFKEIYMKVGAVFIWLVIKNASGKQ